MREEGRQQSNVVELARFRTKKAPEEPVALPQVYGRINAKNMVEYGLIGVSAADSVRLLRALMHVGMRLLEIGGQ